MDVKIEERVIRILKKELGIRSRKPITRDYHLVHDLNMSEQTYNCVTDRLSRSFKTDLDPEVSKAITTVGGLVDYVRQNLEKDQSKNYR